MEEGKKDLIKNMIAVNRVTKVVKGGRIMRFAALVVVGDGEGQVGIGTGKAREVSVAVQKATENARVSMSRIALSGNTICHVVYGRHGASTVYMQPASSGTGVIAGGAVRPLLEAVGVRDVLAKNIGSTNPYNVLRAAMNALVSTRSPAEVADRRGLPLDLINRRHRLVGVY